VKSLKLDQINICALFEWKWNTVNSSILRIIIALANCWLREKFETREREAEYYNTRIVF
jgi:hypothetical protein